MKIKLILFAALALCGLELLSQENRHERIEALRVRFITQQLDLSVEEAKYFWPVYDAYKEKERAIEKSKRADLLKLKGYKGGLKEMPETELEELLNNQVRRERELVELRETYLQEFKKVLPLYKVALLFKAELEFNRKLLEELRARRKGR